MVNIHRRVLALLILQIYVSAAPSDILKAEDTVKIENEQPKLNITKPSSLEDNKQDSNSTENQRQKRFYNHYNPFGYDFPPNNPAPYPTYNKRDQASDLGVYGIDDPLSQIHRQLHDIASVVRQRPPPPPPVSPHPFFFPVIFIPQVGCHCNPGSDNNTPVTEKPVETSRPTVKPVDDSTNSPDINNRVPNIDDERQNWGLVVNDKEEPEDDGEDFSRPISFDPIELDTSKLRPAPPVEHGSSQAGAPNGGQSTTTVRPRPSNDRPRQPSNDRPRPPSSDSPRPPAAAAGSVATTADPYPPSSAESPREVPTTCDGAVLSCCHQLQVTYDCFSILGCPDPTSYGNPCDPLVILRVIEKYQNFYGARTG